MKNILILLLLIPFFGFAQIQDEYYRVSDWTFLPDSVVQLTDTTYSIFAEPANYNDPGSIDRIVGGYVVDFVGHRYVVIDSTDTHLTLFDIYKTGQAPQTGQIAHCYRSVGNGEADFIGSVDYSTLDASARWKINGADNELMWQKVKTKVPYLGAESDVDLGENSISTDTVKIDGVPLLLNTFKQGNLGGVGNIFYSTGASSQPASGTVNQVVGNNYIQNQITTAQPANMWISGDITNGGITTHIRNGLTSTSQILFKTNTTFDWFLGQSPLGASNNDLALFSYGMGDIIANFNKETSASTFGTANTGYFGHHLITKSDYGSGIKFINGKTDNADVRNFSIQSDNFEYGDLAISKSTNQSGATDVNLLYFAK